MSGKYGFYTEKYSDTNEIQTLMTGDGNTQFIDIKYKNGISAIGIAYGIDGEIGEKNSINRQVDESMKIKWQIKFENQLSVDAMISALLRVKNNIGTSPCVAQLTDELEGHT